MKTASLISRVSAMMHANLLLIAVCWRLSILCCRGHRFGPNKKGGLRTLQILRFEILPLQPLQKLVTYAWPMLTKMSEKCHMSSDEKRVYPISATNPKSWNSAAGRLLRTVWGVFYNYLPCTAWSIAVPDDAEFGSFLEVSEVGLGP